jgi:hypothetical protein
MTNSKNSSNKYSKSNDLSAKEETSGQDLI